MLYQERLVREGYASDYRALTCSTTLASVNGTDGYLHTPWYNQGMNASTATLDDGKLVRLQPFFSYNGPGTSGVYQAVYQNNPIGYDETIGGSVSAVRSTYGYAHSGGWAINRQLSGTFKLIGCPSLRTRFGDGSKSIYWYGPHGSLSYGNHLGIGGAYWQGHYRIFGYTDGHVEAQNLATRSASPL